MHDVPSPGAAEGAAAPASAIGWRDLLEQRHSALVEGLGQAIEAERQDAATGAVAAERAQSAARIEAARSEARRLQAESLHQALRRLRHTSEDREILESLNESTTPYAERSVVVVFENSQAVTVAMRGSEDNTPIVFGIGDAPALAEAIDSRDTVVALASPAEISSVLGKVFEGVEGTKAYLFPLSVRQSVRAILIAAGAVASAPIELLCEAAGIKLESASPASIKMPVSEFVQLTPPAPAAKSGRSAWAELSAEDQQHHLQAQRMARVRTASLRLNHDEELRRGVAGRDIYGALMNEIEAARRDFAETYVSKSDTMVDYLHLEILSRLAHDDETLLGPGYPGPMV